MMNSSAVPSKNKNERIAIVSVHPAIGVVMSVGTYMIATAITLMVPTGSRVNFPVQIDSLSFVL